ncbi:hypothetical protein B0H16DRAFT_1448046 [Mycena metata]|uniref:Uncharacterized protein n=1 Tax=Mycena metata TaxID=1033252 RepID=A0AAD7KBB2_9AGAR|nr:hypothetical protein B0H16DRAFT_1448046 [Mycena metata]
MFAMLLRNSSRCLCLVIPHQGYSAWSIRYQLGESGTPHLGDWSGIRTFAQLPEAQQQQNLVYRRPRKRDSRLEKPAVKKSYVESDVYPAVTVIAVAITAMLTLLTEESELIVKLCQVVDFEKNLSWMGTGGFVNAIEELWQTACHIGYTHRLEDAESRSPQASPVLAVSVAATQVDAVDTPAVAPSMSAPSLPPNDAQIERVLLETVPWDARKKGGRVLQQCIRDLWDKAASMALNYTEEKYEKARAAVNLEKELEKERVWGFDVGWKLRSEQLQSRTLQASVIPPLHSPPRAAPAAAPLDWAEDAAIGPTAARFLGTSYGRTSAVRELATPPSTRSATCDFVVTE